MEVEQDEEGDGVTVRIIIHNVNKQLSHQENYLDIVNGVAQDKILRIPFNILFVEAPIIETTTTEISTEGPEQDTEASPEVWAEEERHQEPVVKVESL